MRDHGSQSDAGPATRPWVAVTEGGRPVLALRATGLRLSDDLRAAMASPPGDLLRSCDAADPLRPLIPVQPPESLFRIGAWDAAPGAIPAVDGRDHTAAIAHLRNALTRIRAGLAAQALYYTVVDHDNRIQYLAIVFDRTSGRIVAWTPPTDRPDQVTAELETSWTLLNWRGEIAGHFQPPL